MSIGLKKGESIVDSTSVLLQQLNDLFENEQMSDVTFVVQNTKIPAHKTILGLQSAYFLAMFYGNWSESSKNEIELEQVRLQPFKLTLKFFYTRHISLEGIDQSDILEILDLAIQYDLEALELIVLKYLSTTLSLQNYVLILNFGVLRELEMLINGCMRFIDKNAIKLLDHSSFHTLSTESLCRILKRDSFFAPETLIFNAVLDWYKQNQSAENKTVFSFIRMSLMSITELFEIIKPCLIDGSVFLFDIIQLLVAITPIKPQHRGALYFGENVASAKFNSKTIMGTYGSVLLNGNCKDYGPSSGYTQHSITDEELIKCIIVELGTVNIINHIKMLLWDLDDRSYSYYIEVSTDKNEWHRVIDHTRYYCRSWQLLYFSSRAVRYIKLVGTHNTVNKNFHVVTLEAYYMQNQPELVDGLISPMHNVATKEMSAIIIKGLSEPSNAMLNGDIKKYNLSSGYSSHTIDNESLGIVLQLGQPYFIGSMRLLLWDLDPREYSFYIETSTNSKDWETVVDKRKEQLRSWQQFTFEPRPVVFIRIIGTHNTANIDFHCVHFECPSQDLPKA